MWWKAAGVVLALSIGFFLYRAALVAIPIEPYAGTSPTLTCPEGNVPRAQFDTLTGFPAGVIVSCASRDGERAVQWGPIEAALLGGHWGRSAMFGLAAAGVGLIVLWWFWRRQPGAVQRRSALLTSA